MSEWEQIIRKKRVSCAHGRCTGISRSRFSERNLESHSTRHTIIIARYQHRVLTLAGIQWDENRYQCVEGNRLTLQTVNTIFRSVLNTACVGGSELQCFHLPEKVLAVPPVADTDEKTIDCPCRLPIIHSAVFLQA